MATTFLELRDACKSRADMSGSAQSDNFIEDPEWGFLVNSRLAEFHDLVVRNDVRMYLTSSQFTVNASNTTGRVALPADFMTLDGVERSSDGSGGEDTWYDVRKFAWQDRNRQNAFNVWSQLMPPEVRYNLVDNEILFKPARNVPGTYRIWYYPTAPKLVNDSDTFDDQRYWYEYVVVGVAITAKDKQEDDTQVLQSQLAMLKERITQMGSDRDFAEPEQAGRKDTDRGGGWY